MTVLASSVEEILEKLVRIAGGDPALVQEALARASSRPAHPPTLEEIVDYILSHRKQAPEPQN